jgi:hypothetical protein
VSVQTPFLLPVSIDGIDPATARVPEAFRRVLWLHLRHYDGLEQLAGEIAHEYRKKMEMLR